MTEYIIILALVAIGSIAVFNIFGDNIRALVGTSANKMGGDDTKIDGTSVQSTDVNKTMSDF